MSLRKNVLDLCVRNRSIRVVRGDASGVGSGEGAGGAARVPACESRRRAERGALRATAPPAAGPQAGDARSLEQLFFVRLVGSTPVEALLRDILLNGPTLAGRSSATPDVASARAGRPSGRRRDRRPDLAARRRHEQQSNYPVTTEPEPHLSHLQCLTRFVFNVQSSQLLFIILLVSLF